MVQVNTYHAGRSWCNLFSFIHHNKVSERSLTFSLTMDIRVRWGVGATQIPMCVCVSVSQYLVSLVAIHSIFGCHMSDIFSFSLILIFFIYYHYYCVLFSYPSHPFVLIVNIPIVCSSLANLKKYLYI